MLMAYEKGADLIVSVGAHFNLIEFLDRKRGGMSSTFLTRLRIGEKLVDAKGVSRLYNPSSGVRPRGPLPRRLRDPAGDRRHHLAGAQRPRRTDLAEDQDLAGAVAAALAFPADGLQRALPRDIADRGLPRPRDRDPDRRRARRRHADEHPQEPRAAASPATSQDARDRADELSGELGRANEFADRVYPVLVARPAATGGGSALVALGDLPGDVSDAIEEALGPTGARLVGVGVVREPVDLRGAGRRPLEDPLRRHRAATPTRQTAFGVGVGRQIVRRRHPARTGCAATSSRGRAATSAPSTG